MHRLGYLIVFKHVARSYVRRPGRGRLGRGRLGRGRLGRGRLGRIGDAEVFEHNRNIAVRRAASSLFAYFYSLPGAGAQSVFLAVGALQVELIRMIQLAIDDHPNGSGEIHSIFVRMRTKIPRIQIGLCTIHPKYN
jgi:hypothetical protein